MITQEMLKKFLRYNSRTGVFKNRVQRGTRGAPGAVAGSIAKSGYVELQLLGKRYYAHRLAWFYVHGVWPTQVDHRNGVRSDNKLTNLRSADALCNAQNLARRDQNTSGFTGASKMRNKWRAQIKVANKQHFLGAFDTPEDAHAAYIKAKREFHKFQPTLRQG